MGEGYPWGHLQSNSGLPYGKFSLTRARRGGIEQASYPRAYGNRTGWFNIIKKERVKWVLLKLVTRLQTYERRMIVVPFDKVRCLIPRSIQDQLFGTIWRLLKLDAGWDEGYGSTKSPPSWINTTRQASSHMLTTWQVWHTILVSSDLDRKSWRKGLAAGEPQYFAGAMLAASFLYIQRRRNHIIKLSQ